MGEIHNKDTTILPQSMLDALLLELLDQVCWFKSSVSLINL